MGKLWKSDPKKEKDACKNAGEEIAYHFPDVRKMVAIGSGAEEDRWYFLLTRYACYLVAQNGDSRKQEIAFAQKYLLFKLVERISGATTFGTWTGKSEKNSVKPKNKLSGILYERGVDSQGFAVIRSKRRSGVIQIEHSNAQKENGST